MPDPLPPKRAADNRVPEGLPSPATPTPPAGDSHPAPEGVPKTRLWLVKHYGRGVSARIYKFDHLWRLRA